MLISGSISVPGSNLVSGSAQIDVLSTTNIARLATTGSNIFTGEITGTNAKFSGGICASSFNPTGSTISCNGMYLPSGNTLGFSTNGTNRLTLSSTGAATFSSSVSVNSLNINTSNVFAKANISDALTATSIGTNYNPGILNIQNSNTTNGNLSLIGFQDANAFINLAAVGAINNIHSASPNSVVGSLAFYTKASGGAYITEKMRINGDGNVGIGTTSPDQPLHVLKSTTITNDITEVIHIQAKTTGTLASGFGPSIGFWGAFTGGNNVELGQIGAVNTNINGANGDIVFYTRPNAPIVERMRITSAGNVLVGTVTDISQKFTVSGNIVSNGEIGTNILLSRDNSNSTMYGFFNNGTGSYTLTNFNVSNVATINMSTGAYTPISDINKKKDFEESTIGLKEVLQLKPTLYRIKTQDETTDKELGFIAQEVKEFIPQAYVENGDYNYKFIGLNYNAITATLVKAIQEQQCRINLLETCLGVV
jgi:hypothetical protein